MFKLSDTNLFRYSPKFLPLLVSVCMVVDSVITFGTGIGGSIYCIPAVFRIEVSGTCVSNGPPIAYCVILLTLSCFVSVTSLLGTVRIAPNVMGFVSFVGALLFLAFDWMLVGNISAIRAPLVDHTNHPLGDTIESTLFASLSFAVIGGVLGFLFLIFSVQKHTFVKKVYHKERDETNMDGGASGNNDNKEEVEAI